MAYSLPVFNKTCAVFNPPNAVGPSIGWMDQPLQVKGAPKLTALSVNQQGPGWAAIELMKFPARTYVIGRISDGVGSVITLLPEGTAQYEALIVYDVAAGFPNEYRAAIVRRYGPLPNDIPS